jgi:hypothetical protein
MSLFSTLNLSPAEFAETPQGKKAIELAASNVLEEELKDCVCWTVVVAANNGDITSTHTEYEVGYLNATSNAAPVAKGQAPHFMLEADTDDEDYSTSGTGISQIIGKKTASMASVRLHLGIPEAKQLVKQLDRRPTNINSGAKSCQFKVWAKACATLELNGQQPTFGLQVIHVDYNSFSIPTGGVPTAEEASEAINNMLEANKQRRVDGLAKAADRAKARMEARSSVMSSDVLAGAAEPTTIEGVLEEDAAAL